MATPPGSRERRRRATASSPPRPGPTSATAAISIPTRLRFALAVASHGGRVGDGGERGPAHERLLVVLEQSDHGGAHPAPARQKQAPELDLAHPTPLSSGGAAG